jgi:hypothetical protein
MVIFSIDNNNLIIHINKPLTTIQQFEILINIYNIGKFNKFMIHPLKKLDWFEYRCLIYSGFEDQNGMFIYME